MPLFELLRLSKTKLDSSSQQEKPSCSTHSSFAPESDFAELVWENGQVGDSSRTKRSLDSTSLASQDPELSANETNAKMAKFGLMDTGFDGVPSGEVNLNQDDDDDDMVPWLNYPVDDYLSEFSGVTVNELSSDKNNVSYFDKRSRSHQPVRNSSTFSVHNGLSLEQGDAPKISAAGGGEDIRPLSSSSQMRSLSSHQCQKFPYFRSRFSDTIGDSSKNASSLTLSGNSTQGSTLANGVYKQDALPISSNPKVMNFSHFARPAALVKASLENASANSSIGLSNMEKMSGKDKGSAASYINLVNSNVDSFGRLRKEASSQCQSAMMTSKVDIKPLKSKPVDAFGTAEQLESLFRKDAYKNNAYCGQINGENLNRGLKDAEKASEPGVATSSVCSGNSAERASDEPTNNLKRKGRNTEESEGPSEDAEEESKDVKKAAPTRAAGSKRSRAAEVHNLSERRRRDRINEKMHALQELIPNCSKVDKASMLDEAIEYLKTLQLQVQIMSMGAGLYMPPMMLPTGMQPMHPAHLGHFSSMGVGVGMGMGMAMGFGMGGIPDMNAGSSSCPIIQVPPMHGAYFHSPQIPVPTALQGMAGSNMQMFGLPSQGLPLSMPRAPLYPMPAGHIMNSSMALGGCGTIGPINNSDSATAPNSKEMVRNIDSQVLQNAGGSSSMNQTSDQCQATNEKFGQSSLVQDNGQTSEGNCNEPFISGNGNADIPSTNRPSCGL